MFDITESQNWRIFCILFSFPYLALEVFVDWHTVVNLMFSLFAVPAFRDVIDVPLVVRRLHKSRQEVWFWTTFEAALLFDIYLILM